MGPSTIAKDKTTMLWLDDGFEQPIVYDDGGRAEAGYIGSAKDCVTRAIAIATGQSYLKVYNDLADYMKDYAANRRDKVARSIQKKRAKTPRNGVHKEVYSLYLNHKNWEWEPTMNIGSGCQTHLRADELPEGRIIASVSRHIVAVIDGVIHDTHNPCRGGSRCVYGYYYKLS